MWWGTECVCGEGGCPGPLEATVKPSCLSRRHPPFLTLKLRTTKLTPSLLGLKYRVSQGPGISGKGPEGATSLHPGGEEAGRSRSAGAGEWVGRREGEREEGGEAGKMPLPGAGRGRGSGRGTAAVLGGGGGCNVTLLGVRCVSPKLRAPLAYIFPVPPRDRGGGGGQGTAEPSPERDANRQSWEKVNKGHAPCRRPAGAHPPLRRPPVHFHSQQRFSPAGLARSPGRWGVGGLPPTPARAPRPGAVNPPYSPGKGIPRPSKKLLNLCRASAPGSRACCPRVHSPRAPSRERGQQGGGGGPRKVSGPDRLHVSPARGHVHRLDPVRRPDVLRINKMKLGETGGQIPPGPPNLRPRPRDLLSAQVSSRSPSAQPEPAGQVAAQARPRPPAPPPRPRGALPQSLIKKVAKLTLPKVVVACAPLSLPAMYSLKHD